MALEDKLKDAEVALSHDMTETAIEILDRLHVECHAEAGLHIKTHVALAKAHRKAGNYKRAAFEIAAIPFAGPASLAHKYLGVSRKL